MDDQACARLRASPAFQELERGRGALGLGLTIAMLVIYFGFVGSGRLRTGADGHARLRHDDAGLSARARRDPERHRC